MHTIFVMSFREAIANIVAMDDRDRQADTLCSPTKRGTVLSVLDALILSAQYKGRIGAHSTYLETLNK